MLELRERHITLMNSVIGKMLMTLMAGWKLNVERSYHLLVGQEMRGHDFGRRSPLH